MAECEDHRAVFSARHRACGRLSALRPRKRHGQPVWERQSLWGAHGRLDRRADLRVRGRNYPAPPAMARLRDEHGRRRRVHAYRPRYEDNEPRRRQNSPWNEEFRVLPALRHGVRVPDRAADKSGAVTRRRALVPRFIGELYTWSGVNRDCIKHPNLQTLLKNIARQCIL